MYRWGRRSLKGIIYEKYYSIKYRLHNLLYGGFGVEPGYMGSRSFYRGGSQFYGRRDFGRGALGRKGHGGGKRFRYDKRW